jgi:formylmethanofuran dehydrogenase subunit E
MTSNFQREFLNNFPLKKSSQKWQQSGTRQTLALLFRRGLISVAPALRHRPKKNSEKFFEGCYVNFNIRPFWLIIMQDFETLLKGSALAHGHLCPGQVVGVRMAMLGCRLIGLDDPGAPDQIKKIIVYLEMDRCTSDAVAHVTGVKLGRRSLKFMDYGIMAATFVNLETEKAYRILSTEEARDLVSVYAPEINEKSTQQLEAYLRMPDSVLFRVQKVQVPISEFDLPGPTRSKLSCSQCGQVVRDHREVQVEGMTLCKPCACGAYFENAQEVTWPDMNWRPQNGSERTLLSSEPDVLNVDDNELCFATPNVSKKETPSC